MVKQQKKEAQLHRIMLQKCCCVQKQKQTSDTDDSTKDVAVYQPAKQVTTMNTDNFGESSLGFETGL